MTTTMQHAWRRIGLMLKDDCKWMEPLGRKNYERKKWYEDAAVADNRCGGTEATPHWTPHRTKT